MNVETLWAASARDLAQIMAEGHPIAPRSLVGSYRGVSLGLPSFVDQIAWKVFRKCFLADPDHPDQVIGHNVRVVQQSSLVALAGSSPPEAMMRRGRPLHFGPFAVVSLPGPTPFRCRAGLLLDYGATHPFWHPLARLRDPVVSLRAGSVDLLLGASYLQVGVSLRTPSYFTLERESFDDPPAQKFG